MESASLASAAAFLRGTVFNVQAMRPYFDPTDGKPKVAVVNTETGQTGVAMVANATLQYDEWKDIDRNVIAVATQRLVGVGDLMARGLTHNLGSIGVTVSLWDRSSDMTPAQVDMSAVTPGEEDSITYSQQSVPVPIIHKDFRLNLRRLAASRIMGEGIDVTQSSIASRLVSEKSESMLFSGEPIVVDGATIYGYLTHPDRNQVTMTTAWSSIAQADNDDIVADVSAMQAASRADRHFGPWVLYIPGAYEYKMDQDYRANDNRTLRERVMGLSGIADVKVADFLTGNNVLLVELQRDTVDLAIAQGINTIQWQEMGGMQERFKVMAIWVPRLKSDFDGRSGITHLRPA